MDIEWPVGKGFKQPARIATISICFLNYLKIFEIFVFQINSLKGDTLPMSLVKLFKRRDVTWNGVGIQGDITRLKKQYESVFSDVTFEDLSQLAESRVGLPRGLSLADLTLQLTGSRLDKPTEIRVSPTWGQIPLPQSFVDYAAIDVLACASLRECIFKNQNPVFDDFNQRLLVKDASVVLLTAFGTRTTPVAVGTVCDPSSVPVEFASVFKDKPSPTVCFIRVEKILDFTVKIPLCVHPWDGSPSIRPNLNVYANGIHQMKIVRVPWRHLRVISAGRLSDPSLQVMFGSFKII